MQAASSVVTGKEESRGVDIGGAAPSLPITAGKMAQGLFIGLTECELLEIKAKALALIMDGKTLMSYADSGSSATKAFALPPKEMLNEAMFALSRLDPATYGRRTTMINTRWDNRFD